MLWLAWVGCVSAGPNEIAAVMLVDGDAWIRHADGHRSPATIGHPLEVGDVLVTGSDGAIFVHLANDHVVRIDAELELAVGELVMLKAPPSRTPPGAQVTGLLYPDEIGRLGASVAAAERVAGWHARLTAAQAPTGVVRGGAEPDAESSKEMEEEDAPTAAAPPPPPPGGVPIANESSGASAKPRQTVSSKRKQEERASTSSPARPAPPPKIAPPAEPPQAVPADETSRAVYGDAEVAPGVSLAELEVRFGPAGDLRECVASWSASLLVPLPAVDIALRVRDGKIERAVPQGGLRLPACALDALEGVPFDGVNTTLRVTF